MADRFVAPHELCLGEIAPLGTANGIEFYPVGSASGGGDPLSPPPDRIPLGATHMLAPHSGRNAGRHFLVTGGTQGVGLAIANRLAEEGAAGIIIAGRNRERGEAAAAGLTAQGTDCRFAAADVGDADDCQRLIETALAAFPALDGLVNAAGTAERSGLLDTTLEQWDQHFNINARGPFLLMQGLVCHLLAGARTGSIVNIVSMAAHCGGPQVTPYSASKAALANLTRNTANAFADRGI
ncbi:SDR family NAD(P)-dependent oxidoreductase, partial [Ensifer sp. P24N7]|uniref:SDR family NAD(P)-dependent oxidoreductase n=1 Tax=Sinorhizobium sp. P24N7 TaxID=3348358 RepID=UPI0035F3D790